MQTFNQLVLMGYLGQNPTLSQVKGMSIVKVSLATHENSGSQDKPSRKTTWHPLVFFGKLAETASRTLKKGDRLFVEGKLEHQRWTDKEGKTKYSTSIIVQSIRFIEPKGEEEAAIEPSDVK